MDSFNNKVTRRRFNVTTSVALTTALIGTSMPAIAIAENMQRDVDHKTNHEQTTKARVKPATKTQAKVQLDKAQTKADELSQAITKADNLINQSTTEYNNLLEVKDAKQEKYKTAETSLKEALLKLKDAVAEESLAAQAELDKAQANKEKAQKALNSARKDKDAVDAALAESQEKLDAAKANAGEDIEEQLKESEKNINAAFEDYKLADAAKKKAQSDYTKAKSQLSQAKRDADAKQQALNEAESQLNDARAEKERLQAALNQAQSALDAALTDENKQKLQQAQEAYHQAELKLSFAIISLEKAQTQRDEAKAAQDEASLFTLDKYSEKEAAEQALSEAEAEQTKAQAAYDEAVLQKENLIKERESAQANISSLEAEVLSNTEAVEAAEQEIARIEKELEQAQSQLDLAIESAGVSDEKLESGAFAFFKDKKKSEHDSPAEAYDIIDYGSDEGMVHYGEQGDATSLEMIDEALGYLKELNKLRVSEGLDPFLVSYESMAWAMFDADWLSDYEHDREREVNPWEFHEDENENILNVSYGNPIVDMYWIEKVVYNENHGLEVSPELAAYKETDLYKYLKEKGYLGNTSRYENIINPDFKVAGFAVCRGYYDGHFFRNIPTVMVNTFSTDADNVETFTIDEYKKMFHDWMDDCWSVYDIRDKLEAKVNTIKAQKASQEETLNLAVSKKQENQEKLNDALQAVEALQENINEAETAIQTASEQRDQMDQNVATAQANKVQAEQAYADAEAQAQKKGEILLAAEEKVIEATVASREAHNEFDQARDALNELETRLNIDTLTSNRDQAQKNLDQAIQACETAEQTKTRAEEERDGAQANVQSKQEASDTKKQEADEANEHFKAVNRIFQDAGRHRNDLLLKYHALEKVQQEYDKVQQQQLEVQQKFNDAESELNTASRSYDAAWEKKDQAKKDNLAAKALVDSFQGHNTPEITYARYVHFNDDIKQLKNLQEGLATCEADVLQAMQNLDDAKADRETAKKNYAEALALVAIAQANLDWFNFKVIEGDGQTVKTNASCRFVVDANSEQFESVKIDGSVVDKKNYSVSSGSTVIVFNKEFVKTLSEGSHNLEVLYSNEGAAKASFKVEKAYEPKHENPDQTSSQAVNNVKPKHAKGEKANLPKAVKPKHAQAEKVSNQLPRTGDASSVYPAAMALLGLAGIVGTRKVKGKHARK